MDGWNGAHIPRNNSFLTKIVTSTFPYFVSPSEEALLSLSLSLSLSLPPSFLVLSAAAASASAAVTLIAIFD